MKKSIVFILAMLFAMIGQTSCLKDFETSDISVKEKSRETVYFFHLPTCSYSKAAKQYIEKNYPNVPVNFIDISKEENDDILKVAMKEYGIGKNVSTPLICLGVNHIEGWDFNEEKRLDIYIQSYLK